MAKHHDHHYDKFYIDGKWVLPKVAGAKFEVTDASTEQVIASVPNGSAADVNAAVEAAARAFPGWSETALSVRTAMMGKLHDGLERRTDELALVISQELGMPINLSVAVQVGSPLKILKSVMEKAGAIEWETVVPNERGASSLVVREAYGVVSCITPWNYPLMQIATKVFPALIAGCTVIVKPSEVAPLDANILAEVCDEIGLPPGVFNLVHGSGQDVGEPMCIHPLVDMVSFTGSTAAGQRVGALAAQHVKKCKLELGGKSAHIVLDDVDLKKTLPKSVRGGVLMNSGQTCSAQTRMLVPRALQDEAASLVAEAFAKTPVGPSTDPNAFMGPLISKRQQERVRQYIQTGIDEGATLVTGGTAMPAHLSTGYFVAPTVFKNVKNSMTIAQEEIFGPVLCIIPYDTEEEAIAIANDSIYGLSGAVTSGSLDRAKQVGRRIRTGEVVLNGGPFNPNAPFGGYKKSGIGRERGSVGIEEFLQTKSFHIPKIKSKM